MSGAVPATTSSQGQPPARVVTGAPGPQFRPEPQLTAMIRFADGLVICANELGPAVLRPGDGPDGTEEAGLELQGGLELAGPERGEERGPHRVVAHGGEEDRGPEQIEQSRGPDDRADRGVGICRSRQIVNLCMASSSRS